VHTIRQVREDPTKLSGLDEIRLLAETGFLTQARLRVRERSNHDHDDPELLGLKAQLDHRAGAISDAVDGWRRLHELSPHSHTALWRIASLRHEAATEQGTDLPLVRRAVKAATERQHARAIAMCAEGEALALAAHDVEQAKLLFLLEAMIHEMEGRLAHATRALERLGADGRFAHDVDRLALLARIEERKGDGGSLRAAERVLSFLASSGKLSAYPRLTSVLRAMGDEEGASRIERSFEEAFRRRMQWLTPEERLAAAARCFVPAGRLGSLELPPPEEAPDRLQRGIGLLARGNVEAALASLPGDAHAWRACALLEAGEAEAALEAAIVAVLDDGVPNEPLARLLAACIRACAGPTRHERRNVPEEALRLSLDALRCTASAGPPGPGALRCLAVLEEHAGRGEVASHLRERAAALHERPWPPPGVVRAAAVFALNGKLKGLVHDVIARRIPAEASRGGQLLDREIHGELGEGVREQIRRTFAAVRETLCARYPERIPEFDSWCYGLHLTKEDEPSGGPSLGLPVAVAFASCLLQIRAPSDHVFTGAISYDGAGKLTVRQVGELGLKLKGTLHAGARALVLPAQQVEEATAGVEVPRSIALRAVVPVTSLDDVLAGLLRG